MPFQHPELSILVGEGMRLATACSDAAVLGSGDEACCRSASAVVDCGATPGRHRWASNGGKHSEGRLNRWAVCLTQRGGGESMTISVSFRAPLH